MSESSDQIQEAAVEAVKDPKKIEIVAGALSGASRRARQNAAAIMHEVALANPKLVVKYKDDLVDALNRPEARTRWECLDILTLLVDVDASACEEAVGDSEASLFDEESGPARLAAVRFLCKLGATSPERSEKVWPLIDEAIQCYHGDMEFSEMLAAVTEFSLGNLSDEVKGKLGARMSFDASSNKGSLGRRAKQILVNVGMAE